MKCPKCKYEWDTHSERMFVTCPNCLLKVKREEKSQTSQGKVPPEFN